MTDNTPNLPVPGDPPNPVKQPYITEPLEGAKKPRTVLVKGGGEPFHNVRMVTPGTEDILSKKEGTMGKDGTFTLELRQDIPKGRFCFQVILWKKNGVLGRTPTRCIEIV